jgi:hypothetical protein
MAVVTSGLLGVNIEETPSSNSRGHALGTLVQGTDSQEYLYVLAGSAITQYQVVGVDENYSAYPLTKAMADDGWHIGAAQVAFASGDYGWVAVRGSNVTIKVLGACAADVALYTSGTAGSLDDTATSQTKIDGIVLVTAAATAASSRESIMTFPRSSTF